VNERTSRCRRSIFSLSFSGMRYPRPLSTKAKTLLWKAVGVSSLVFGLECQGVTVRDLKRLETTQGNFVKGIVKRSRYSKLLLALGIPKITEIIKRNTVSLYSRIFKYDYPARQFNIELLTKCLTTGQRVKGTIGSCP
jgi:hypothetical protein